MVKKGAVIGRLIA